MGGGGAQEGGEAPRPERLIGHPLSIPTHPPATARLTPLPPLVPLLQDTESERIVQDALNRMILGRTTVVVAHRLSTIKAGMGWRGG